MWKTKTATVNRAGMPSLSVSPSRRNSVARPSREKLLGSPRQNRRSLQLSRRKTDAQSDERNEPAKNPDRYKLAREDEVNVLSRFLDLDCHSFSGGADWADEKRT